MIVRRSAPRFQGLTLLELLLGLTLVTGLSVMLITSMQQVRGSLRDSERCLVARSLLSFLAHESLLGGRMATTPLERTPAHQVPGLTGWIRQAAPGTDAGAAWDGLQIERRSVVDQGESGILLVATWSQGGRERSISLEVLLPAGGVR